jgi:energy-coupling factor transporter ATP-binding protein EcfA2
MPYRTISIIGMAKNSGKTTTLNYLIEAYKKEGATLGVTSVGRDGERVDEVTKTEKPGIHVYKGTVIATAEKLLPLCDITKEMIKTTEMNTPLGYVVLVRALSDGFVQLGGPSIVAQLAKLIKHIPGDKILVDGAVSRKSSANPTVTEAVVLCSGAGLNRNMQKTIEETRHAVNLLTLPACNETASDTCVYLKGAVTDAAIYALELFTGLTIVAQDPTRLFISPKTYEKLQFNNIKLAVRTPIRLVGLTVNPTSPYHIGYNPDEFLQRMREAVSLPVYNLKIKE